MSELISDNSMCCEGDKQVSGGGSCPLRCYGQGGRATWNCQNGQQVSTARRVESPHSKLTVSKLSVNVGCSRKKKEWGAVTKPPISNGIPSDGISLHDL